MTIVVGIVVLLGWLLDVPLLVNVFGGRNMLPSTAGCFVIVGVSLRLWMAHRPPTTLAALLGGVVALVGALTIIEHATNIDLVTGLTAADASLRMAVPTAVSFVGVGIALVLFDKEWRTVRIAEVLGLACCAIAIASMFDLFLSLFDDGVDHPAKYRMAVYTAALFLVVAAAIIIARPTRGWMATIANESASARVGFGLILSVLPTVAGISFLRFLGERYGLYDTRYGISLMVGAMVFVMVAISWRTLRELQRIEGDVRQARAVLDAIVENIPHMIFVKDGRDLRFSRFNAAGERLLGIKREDLVGKTDFDLFPKQQAARFQEEDRATLAGNAIVDIPEEEIDTKSGKRWLHTVKVPVEGTGEPFLLGISEDITERKHAADELRQAKETAEATSKELEAFSYAVSHDLRAPLRSIDGFSLALLEDSGHRLEADGQDHLRRVRAAAQKMAGLIDDLLNLSRVSRQEMKREPIDVSALAASVVSELRRAHRARQVEVVIAPGMATVGDARLIEVLLENLIGNAWKFTGKRPAARIEIGGIDIADERCFFVSDDGAGFDMAYVGKLFGAFQRLHAASDFEGTGTGIGLATVQRIAHRHGGRVWAQGAVGKGATFTFTLATATLAVVPVLEEDR